MFSWWMLALRAVLTLHALRSLATVLVVFVLAFCLSSVMPASAGETGCQGPEPSPGMCGPTSAPGSIPAVVQHGPQVHWASVSTAWLFAASLPRLAFQLYAAPSPPRAPPFSLA